MMMCLGQFVFSLHTLAYQEFKRQTQWKHPSTSRVGASDAHQFTGKGDDKITLSGWFAPEFNGSPLALNILRAMGDTGRPFVLVEGTGRIYGQWIITDLEEGKTHFDANGNARRIDFTLSIKCVDDNVNTAVGNVRDTISSYLPSGMTVPDIPKIPTIDDVLR